MKIYIGLGPITILKNSKNVLLNILSNHDLDKVNEFIYHKILIDLDAHEFMPGLSWFSTDVGKIICNRFPILCGDILGAFLSANSDLDSYDRLAVLAEHEPC